MNGYSNAVKYTNYRNSLQKSNRIGPFASIPYRSGLHLRVSCILLFIIHSRVGIYNHAALELSASDSMDFDNTGNKRQLDMELDRFEKKLAELKAQYEQFFLDIAKRPPDELHREVKTLLRQLQSAPFKNASLVFRLRTLQQRYQTYDTYWARVMRERENGTYSRDLFKATLRQQPLEKSSSKQRRSVNKDAGIQKLFEQYQTALKTNSGSAEALSFPEFKKELNKKSAELRKQHKGKKIQCKLVLKDGQISLKASSRNNS